MGLILLRYLINIVININGRKCAIHTGVLYFIAGVLNLINCTLTSTLVTSGVLEYCGEKFIVEAVKYSYV